MATKTITQLHRVIFSQVIDGVETPYTLEPDDLGQDEQCTYNIAPRKTTRSSSVGTTEKPIPGTFDSLSASITMLNTYWKKLAKLLGIWEPATYAGADANAGHAIYGDGTSGCGDGVPTRVIVQGICDDGSTADVEFTRCYPSVDDDKTVGSGDTQEITINLNPQIYNPVTDADDGLPAYTVREGDYSLTKNQRYNVTTGEYADVVEPSA